MRVEFYKVESHGRLHAAWDAPRGKRTKVPGTVMAGGKGIPHDLAQYVIEAATGYRDGFWELVAKGATFKSTRRRRTKPGRAVIAEHRRELAGAETLAATHLELWRGGDASPVSQALSQALDQWNDLSANERLTFEWPSANGRVVDSEKAPKRDGLGPNDCDAATLSPHMYDQVRLREPPRRSSDEALGSSGSGQLRREPRVIGPRNRTGQLPSSSSSSRRGAMG